MECGVQNAVLIPEQFYRRDFTNPDSNKVTTFHKLKILEINVINEENT